LPKGKRKEVTGSPVALFCLHYPSLSVSRDVGRTSSARIRATTTNNRSSPTLSYDLAGRKTAMSDPDMGTWSYEYDANGNLIYQTDARGQHLCFRYDPLNRLTAKGLGTPTNCSAFAWYGYDEAGHGQGAIGQRTSRYSFSRTQPNSDWIRTDWYYDSRGRVVSETHRLWGNVYTLRFSYTPADQVATLTYPDGEVVTQSYTNQRGLPTRLSSSLATYVDRASYTFYAKLERLTLGNGLDTTYTYDPLFRLASLTTALGRTSVQRLAYSYDLSDNVTAITDEVLRETQGFSYDALNRLVTASASTSTQGSATTYAHSYTYDALGNLVRVTRDGTSCDYSYGSQPHAVTRVTCGSVQASYAYDANGNMTTRSQGGVSYQQQYDAENRLIRVTRTVGTRLEVTTFYYDADGNRVRQVAADGTSTLYIGQWYEESQSPSRGRVRTNYYYLGGQRVALRQGVVGQAGEVYWLHADHLGSLSEVSTGSTSLYGRQRYYPYGQVRYQWGSLPTTYNFTGQRLDGDTGLLYYGARYYDPALMRFVQADTVVPEPGNPQALNRYAYVLNNPLKYIDSSGRIPVLPILIAGGIALFKAIDYAWTAYDVWQAGQTLADPNSSNLDKALAGLNIALAAGLEAVEPDEALPVSVPVDDVARQGLIKAAREALLAGDDTVLKQLPNWLQPIVRGMATEIKVLDRLGIAKNGRTIKGIVNGQVVDTIPDFIDDTGKVIGKVVGEIKDWSKLDAIQQIRAQVDWARSNGYTYQLIVRRGTEIGPELQDLINRGLIDLKYMRILLDHKGV